MILQGCPLLDRDATCVDWLNTAWAPAADVVICSVHEGARSYLISTSSLWRPLAQGASLATALSAAEAHES
jgi:hypothetical protein